MTKAPLAALLLAAAVGGLSACGTQTQGGSANTAAGNATGAQGDSEARRERRADRPRRGGGRGFLRADANGDGVVTRAEITAEADGRFARLDPNGDGTISAEETAARAARIARRGGNDAAAPRQAGPTTREAFRERAVARFDRRDRDGDGRLAGEELTPSARGRGRDRAQADSDAE